jgi:hypothetical protein
VNQPNRQGTKVSGIIPQFKQTFSTFYDYYVLKTKGGHRQAILMSGARVQKRAN